MKKFLNKIKALFGRGAISSDILLPKALSIKLFPGGNSGKGANYVICFGRNPKFVVNYYIYGLSRQEVLRDLLSIYALWLDVEESFLTPDAQAELFKIYGALARIDYMNQSAHVPPRIIGRITIPNRGTCTWLTSDKVDNEINDAKNATDNCNCKCCPFNKCIFHVLNYTKEQPKGTHHDF